MSNDRLLRFERATRRNVMAEIRPCELERGISRSASRRDRVGIGVRIKPGERTTTGAYKAQHRHANDGRRGLE